MSRSLTVAIAGSGSVGGYIIDYLLSEKKQRVVVLSRNVSTTHMCHRPICYLLLRVICVSKCRLGAT